jgi:two-component system cell cycle sensor histidine kinase/response regulator CckA
MGDKTLQNKMEQLRLKSEDLEKKCRQLEEKLRISEDRFFKIFHASSNMMAITTIKDGRIVDLNEASANLGGFKREELIGAHAEKYVLWADPKQRDAVVPKLTETGSIHNAEVDFLGKFGEIHRVLFSGDPIIINDEPCLLCVSVDITEQKKGEDFLRESEERFRLIAETIDEIFWIYDTEKEIATYISPAYDRIWGHPRENLVGNPEHFLDPIHHEDRERVIAAGKLAKAGKSLDYEYRITRPDGSIRYIWNRGFPVQDKTGKVRIYVGVGQDITEWRLAEEALKESKEYLNRIINCISDPIFVKDREHRFVLVNDALCNASGKTREELIGPLALESLPSELATSFWEHEEDVFKTGKETLTEDILNDTQGICHTVMTKKSLLTDKNGNQQVVGVLRDITDFKRLEAQLLQAQKMEAIGVLAGGVAHDFNNLLNVINGYSELILDELDPENPLRSDLEQIRDAGKRAAALTSQLLAFGRKQIMQPEMLDLNHIITGMSSMLRRMIGEDVELRTDTQPDLGMVHADPGKIQQIILNLAVNARDALPHGGKLTIETANFNFEDEYIHTHPVTTPGRYVMLAISDNGIGMDETTQAHIFEPFFTTKAKGKGTGLGLATVYGIVKQSNGFIWVYSEPGQGTTVKIYFPQVEGENAKTASLSGPETGDRGSETILVVEDEEAVRALTVRILQDRGYHVLAAEDGLEALRVAQDYQEEIHLIVTDVVMPGISGKILVARLETIRPHIKALYISGYTDNSIVHHGILDSNVAFLQKPFSIDSLARKVRAVLNSKSETGI